ncbi:MAG: hypothetical protein IJS45_08340 [Clostridia bacterium]|nr:hypothetical protein [Clostridia bacterium]
MITSGTVFLIVIGIMLIVYGILYFIMPEKLLMFGNRWRYRDATPTDAAVTLGYVSAVICLLAGAAAIVLAVIGIIGAGQPDIPVFEITGEDTSFFAEFTVE